MKIYKNLNHKVLILGLIVLLGAFLRLYKLGEIPNGIYVDEAAIGYNAFTISETGKDEYGYAFPVFLRSFAAFSSPLYVYISAFFIKILGLSASSIRLLSALSGVAAIYIVYLILKKIFSFKNKYSPLLGAFIFAVSPWSIFFSRGAFEANLALFILSIAIYLLLFSNKFKYLIASTILLGISSYAYHPLRFIPILLLPTHFILFRNKNYKLKHFFILMGVFVFSIVPQLVISGTPAFSSRASGLFYGDVLTESASKILFLPEVLSLLLAFAREFGSQLMAYFSPRNLFLLGDSDIQRSIPEMGLLAMWLLVPYVIGLFALSRKLPDKNALFVFAMLLIFAAPAALTRDPFSSLRALNLIVPLIIVVTLGLDFIFSKVNSKIFYLLFAVLASVSFLNLWRGYFVLFPTERAAIWNYGYQELADIVKISDHHFVIDNSRIKPPHILLAFYLKIDPWKYQEYAKTKIINGYYEDTDFDAYYSLQNFETRAINWEQDIYKEQILVGDALAISEEQVKEHFLTEEFKIYDPLNNLIFQGYKTNPKEKCGSVGNKSPQCHPALDAGSM